ARRFESHYDALFPAKTLGTNVWAAIQYTVFHEGRKGVIVGDDGWLYTLEEFRGWPDAEANLRTHLDIIADVDRLLTRQGTTLIVALVPAKARLYPEYRRGVETAPIHAELYARARRGLLDRGITTPDLLSALAECKAAGAVFLRTDTHWTPLGARCAAAELAATAERLGRMTTAPQPFVTEPGPAQAHRGDLMRFLPLAPYFESLLPPPDRIVPAQTFANGPTDLLGDAPAPQAMLVGTSYSADPLWNFAGALKEQLREDVLNLADSGQGPFEPMLAYLRDPRLSPPRLLIWEIPERYLPMQPQTATLPRPRPGSASFRESTLALESRPLAYTL
ncbi:MAG: alginate O-acetyltransferase, partial [Pseudomonadota bacterium]